MFNQLLLLFLNYERYKRGAAYEAEKKLVESCIDACYDYHMGKYDIRYKDKELSKSGKLLSCKAVFEKQTMIGVEVKYNKDKE